MPIKVRPMNVDRICVSSGLESNWVNSIAVEKIKTVLASFKEEN